MRGVGVSVACACLLSACGEVAPTGGGPTDGGSPVRDGASLPPTPAGRVRVVEGPAPVRPLEGALLRAESSSGRVLEASTDAQGTAALDLSPSEGRWSLTAAKRGYAALSIVGLGELPDGDLRLDRVVDFGLSGAPIRGTVAGASPRATVLLDAFNLDVVSLMPGETRFETLYYNELPTLPLALTAIELIDGRPTRITRASAQPRTGAALDGVALRFSDEPSGFRTVRVPVMVPTSSTITTEGVRGFEPSSVQQIDLAFERTSVSVGVGRETMTGPSSFVDFDVVDGVFKPDFAVIRVDASRVRTNLIVHAFDGSEGFAMPSFLTLEASGASLGELTARTDARQADALALHIGEDEEHVPRWRCFVLPSVMAAGARLPTLPGGLTPADLGVTSPMVSFDAIAIWMHAGRPWSTPNSNGAVLGYRMTVTTNHARIASTWR